MKVERTQGLAWRKIGDEVVVINLAAHRIFGLDSTGGRIWEALEQPQDIESLETIVAEDAPEGLNVGDAVRRYVADLSDEGLVTVVEALFDASARSNIVEFPLPRIRWQEELQRFAGACAFHPGQALLCDQQPFNS
jgi:hypothetical protein